MLMNEGFNSNSQVMRRTAELSFKQESALWAKTDRMFALLMILQWLVGIIFAFWISPRTWAGSFSQTHIHVYAAVVLGGFISGLPVLLALLRPGWVLTRHAIAVGQMFTSALLIHLTGGRIETHFHVFGSLAFLAFYRDWRVLVSATIIVALDHGIRGIYWPQSVYGIALIQPWRFLEHAAWVLFEDIFLIYSIHQSRQEMHNVVHQQAQLEEMNRTFEEKVNERTHELGAANRHLDQRLDELRQANEKAKESEKIKSDFLANMSHEFRTPLTLSLAPLESLLASGIGELSDEHRGLLKKMHNNMLRLLQMVTALLDFSKIEAGKIQVNREPTDLAALTRSLLEEFKPLIENRGLRLQYDGPSAQAMVQMDRYLYERIFFNLLSNAVKFTQTGGLIGVTLQIRQTRMHLSVSDTGSGIAEADLGSLFQRFRQVEGSATRRFEGTGLGLALVKEFAQLLGGSVFVESRAGHGSKFMVDCDVPNAENSQKGISSSPAHLKLNQRFFDGDPTPTNGAKALAVQDGAPRILLAEDNKELADYIASLLKNMGEIRICENGKDAFEMAEQWAADLIISDVMMPVMDGFDLCRRIRSHSSTAQIPVLLLTALTDRDSLMKGWEAGAADYLFKPFHPVELLARVRSLIDSVQNAKRSDESQRALFHAEKLAAIGQLAAGVAHELNNPLAGILATTQVVLADVPKQSVQLREDLEAIEVAVRRCKRIVAGLLGFSRNNSFLISAVALDGVIHDVFALVANEAKLAHVEMINKINGVPLVQASVFELQQVLVNLIFNGIQAMPRGGTITIMAQHDKDGVAVRIQDTGEGISPDNLKKVFKPFFTTKPAGQGTGLGLAVSQRIIEKFGGSLTLESPGIGQGTTAALRLLKWKTKAV